MEHPIYYNITLVITVERTEILVYQPHHQNHYREWLLKR